MRAAVNNEHVCVPCDIGTYSDVYGVEFCTECVYPVSTESVGETSCGGIWLNGFKYHIVYYLLAGIILLYIVCWGLAGESSVAIFINMILPMFDHTTDVFYIATIYFHNVTLFVLSVGFLLASGLLFIQELYDDSQLNGYPYIPQLFPSLLWLGSEEGFPTIHKKRVSFVFDIHDDPLKAVWFMLVWMVLFICQTIILIPNILFASPYLLFLFVWFMIGMLFFQR